MTPNVKKIQTSIPPIRKLDAKRINEVCLELDVFLLPRLVEETDLAQILDRQKERLEYDQDPFNPRKPDGFIYRSHLSYAEIFENQDRLIACVADAPGTLSEGQQQVRQHLIEKHRWIYLPIRTLQATQSSDYQSFVPVLRLLPEQSGDQPRFQFGYTADDMPMPVMVFEAASIQTGLIFAYELMGHLWEREQVFFKHVLRKLGQRTAWTPEMLYYGNQLVQQQTVRFIHGQDQITLRRVDPHSRYLLTVDQVIDTPTGAEEDYQRLLMEAADPYAAMRSACGYLAAKQYPMMPEPLWDGQAVCESLGAFYALRDLREGRLDTPCSLQVARRTIQYPTSYRLNWMTASGETYSLIADRQQNPVRGVIVQGQDANINTPVLACWLQKDGVFKLVGASKKPYLLDTRHSLMHPLYAMLLGYLHVMAQ